MEKNTIPSFFAPLLWSYDFDLIDAEKDKKRIIINSVNYGKWLHWAWIVKTYGRAGVSEVIVNTPASEFRPRALRLISLLLGVKQPRYASRSARIRSAQRFSQT